MECRALHGFGASASLGGEASGRFGVFIGQSSLWGLELVLLHHREELRIYLFLAPPGNGVGWVICFDRGFGLWGS